MIGTAFAWVLLGAALVPFGGKAHHQTEKGNRAYEIEEYEEALRAYTLGSAYASFEEDIKGSIAKGRLADLVVLSRPIFEIEPAQLLETEVVMTIVGGRIVYEKE